MCRENMADINIRVLREVKYGSEVGNNYVVKVGK